MIEIDFPEPAFSIRKSEGQDQILDPIRRQWVSLSEEEWVRQNLIQYLINVKQYPQTLIAVEKEILLGERKKRFDILVYSEHLQPWMLIECKAPGVKLDASVLEQVLRYHAVLPADYLVISNGQMTLGWGKNKGQLFELDKLPGWQ